MSSTLSVQPNQEPCFKVKMLCSDGLPNQYAILQDQIIGQGAFSVVKRGLILSQLPTVYAVKIVELENENSRHGAMRQLRVAQQIVMNRHLVRIEKVKIESQKRIYIFMEFCEGGSLRTLLQHNPTASPPPYTLTLFSHLLHGYKSLLSLNILHQDLKPQNILIQSHQFKISDFGMATFTLKPTTRRRGTLKYMAPEKLTKEYLPSVKSDIYSLGVLMFEVMVGRHPYFWSECLALREVMNPELGFFQGMRLQGGERGGIVERIFEIVKRMAQRDHRNRVGWEELWGFYQREGLHRMVGRGWDGQQGIGHNQTIHITRPSNLQMQTRSQVAIQNLDFFQQDIKSPLPKDNLYEQFAHTLTHRLTLVGKSACSNLQDAASHLALIFSQAFKRQLQLIPSHSTQQTARWPEQMDDGMLQRVSNKILASSASLRKEFEGLRVQLEGCGREECERMMHCWVKRLLRTHLSRRGVKGKEYELMRSVVGLVGCLAGMKEEGVERQQELDDAQLEYRIKQYLGQQ